MARSRKRTPIQGIAGCRGMARYKRLRARQERLRLTSALNRMASAEDGERIDVELARWDEWDCPRDGKVWIGWAPSARAMAK